HVVAGAEQGAQQAVLRRQPGRERETATAALQGGEVLLQGGPGGVGAAAVLVAAAQAADTVLLVGGDLVDRRDDRARQGVGGVARVDRERLEVLTDVPVAHGPEGSARGGKMPIRAPRPAGGGGEPGVFHRSGTRLANCRRVLVR